MQFTKMKKQYRWEPISFEISDILMMLENDHCIEFVASYHGQNNWIGVSADYDDGTEEFFDYVYYINDQEFSTFQEFKTQATIDGRLFARLNDKIKVIDTLEGNPKRYYSDLMDLKRRMNND